MAVMDPLLEATLRLFRALPIEAHLERKGDAELAEKTIRHGFVFMPEIIAAYMDFGSLIRLVDKAVGLSPEQMNQALHKSWAKIKEADLEDLVIEQLAHYVTTYGKQSPGFYLEEKGFQWGVEDLVEKVTALPDFEAGRVRDPDYVYVPKEALDLPDLQLDEVKLIVIKGYTKDELKDKLLGLLGSGVALREDTLRAVLEVARFVGLIEGDLASVRNREVKAALYDHLHLLPADPAEFLRYAVFKMTGQTLLIKSPELIQKIDPNRNSRTAKPKRPTINEVFALFMRKGTASGAAQNRPAPPDLKTKSEEATRLFRDYGEKYGLERLAEIFYRFKPLFLAFRLNKEMRTRVNRIRKLAVRYHRPLPESYLNAVTARIKHNGLDVARLNAEMAGVNTFRKVRLAYALKYRTRKVDSILYRVRNGKGYATEFRFTRPEQAAEALDVVLASIVDDLKRNVDGKKIHIPEYIRYCLPATEKQFTGNYPSGTYVTLPDNLITGIHWDNVGGEQTDLDLSLISPVTGKVGWDASYRTGGGEILFSGDMTDASPPLGASELFYVRNQGDGSFIMLVNYYNFREGMEVPFRIIVAHEKADRFQRNYMVDVNHIRAAAESRISRKQKVLGLLVTTPVENRFYYAECYLGRSITSRASEYVRHSQDYLFAFYTETIELNDLLTKAGAQLVREKGQADLDLSPEALEKDTILNLLRFP